MRDEHAADVNDRPLGAYRVVELPGAAPLTVGKTFADLGAEVIKVEPPGGDPARGLPPQAGGRAGLAWTAFSLGKRSVTADLAREDGRALVRRLAAAADVVVEGFPPGVLDGMGLGYGRLREANPGLVLTSLTSFGQEGPYAGWRGSDLVHLAMGGYLYMTGPEDGPPLKPSAPYQSLLHGGMQAVAATLLALRARRRTGRGAHVDQSLRDTVPWMLTHTYQHYDMAGVNLRRRGSARDMGARVRLRSVYRCRDGHVVWVFLTGHVGRRGLEALVERMAEEGMAPDWLRELDWGNVDLLQSGTELAAPLTEAFAAFFATKTKGELLDWAVRYGIMLAPVQTLREVAGDAQLAARGSWQTLDIDGSGAVRVPGPPVRMEGARWEPRDPAPKPGAHNDEVYGGVLGVSPAELAAMRSAGTI